jgi:RNA polymerase sigma-70 factor (family 1)
MAENDLITDLQLVDKLRAGDDTALSAIYKKYWQALYLSAFNVLKDRQLCEDIIQDLFIRLWDHRAGIEIRISLKAYLFASVRYGVYRQIRTGNVRSEIFDDLPESLFAAAPYDRVNHKELIARVSGLIESLPQKCREVYKLSREECLSHKQIASRLNISTKTVENQLTKALHRLRTSLGNSVLFQLLLLFFTAW